MNEDISGTIGIDVGDRRCHFYAVDHRSGEIRRGSFETTADGLRRALEGSAQGRGRVRVVLEVGTHSPWMSRALTAMGYDTVVANPRKLRFIYGTRNKSDRIDAEMLARVGRMDVELVHPIRHRCAEDQHHVAMLRARDGLVAARTRLILTARCLAKSMGMRLPSSSTPAFPKRVREVDLPAPLAQILDPLLASIAVLSERIVCYDKMLSAVCKQARYAVGVKRMTQVTGVGELTALAMHLVLQDPARFARSRNVGPYLGLTPGRDQSGARDTKLGITKQGDPFMRRLLVQSAHYILGPHGPACDLRGFGKRMLDRGAPRKKVVTAVARKLAVLLHSLWRHDSTYEATRASSPGKAASAA